MNGFEKSLPYFPSAGRRARAPSSVLDWSVELRLWVATCVAGLCLFSARALGLPLDETTWGAVGVVFFATLSLYNLDGSLDVSGQNPTAGARSRAARQRLHLGVTGVSALGLFALIGRLSTQALVLTSVGAFVCSLYAIPLTFSRRPKGGSSVLRLKSLPFFKAPFVGCAVGVATVWVPLWARSESYSSASALLLTGALCLYCTDNALLFDIPDVADDRVARVPTVPARYGLRTTRRVSRALASGGLLLSLLFAKQAGPAALGLPGLGVALLAFTELLQFRTGKRTVAWWVDGALLLPFSFQIILAP